MNHKAQEQATEWTNNFRYQVEAEASEDEYAEIKHTIEVYDNEFYTVAQLSGVVIAPQSKIADAGYMNNAFHRATEWYQEQWWKFYNSFNSTAHETAEQMAKWVRSHGFGARVTVDGIVDVYRNDRTVTVAEVRNACYFNDSLPMKRYLGGVLIEVAQEEKSE